jgi:hypothetical protein
MPNGCESRITLLIRPEGEGQRTGVLAKLFGDGWREAYRVVKGRARRMRESTASNATKK